MIIRHPGYRSLELALLDIVMMMPVGSRYSLAQVIEKVINRKQGCCPGKSHRGSYYGGDYSPVFVWIKFSVLPTLDFDRYYALVDDLGENLQLSPEQMQEVTIGQHIGLEFDYGHNSVWVPRKNGHSASYFNPVAEEICEMGYERVLPETLFHNAFTEYGYCHGDDEDLFLKSGLLINQKVLLLADSGWSRSYEDEFDTEMSSTVLYIEPATMDTDRLGGMLDCTISIAPKIM